MPIWLFALLTGIIIAQLALRSPGLEDWGWLGWGVKRGTAGD